MCGDELSSDRWFIPPCIVLGSTSTDAQWSGDEHQGVPGVGWTRSAGGLSLISIILVMVQGVEDPTAISYFDEAASAYIKLLLRVICHWVPFWKEETTGAAAELAPGGSVRHGNQLSVFGQSPPAFLSTASRPC